jgi:hypothetical protein
MDRNLVLNQGMKDYVYGQQQASLLRAEGAFAKAQGKAAMQGSYLAAGGAVLAGIGSAGLASVGNVAGAMGVLGASSIAATSKPASVSGAGQTPPKPASKFSGNPNFL